MKTLKESILSDMDDVLKSGDKFIKDSIKQWLKENLDKGISKCKISRKANNKGLFEVSASGDIEISYKAQSLTNEYFEWSNIDGSFFCTYNNYITTLKGAPKYVSQTFSIKGCKNLETLEGAPETVEEGSFICSYCNSLKSLVGGPKNVGIYFDCSYCHSLETLEGAPEKCGYNAIKYNKLFNCEGCNNLKSLKGCTKNVGIFNCSKCDSLSSLEGGPEKVYKYIIINCTSLKNLSGIAKEIYDFDCRYNLGLESLKGMPELIYNNCYITQCPKLKNLEGCSKTVGNLFSCSDCKNLQSLEGAPNAIGGDFVCRNNTFSEEDIKATTKVHGKIYI